MEDHYCSISKVYHII